MSGSLIWEKLQVVIFEYSESCDARRLKFKNTSIEPSYFCVWFFTVLPLMCTFYLVCLQVSLLSFSVCVVNGFVVDLSELIPIKMVRWVWNINHHDICKVQGWEIQWFEQLQIVESESKLGAPMVGKDKKHC